MTDLPPIPTPVKAKGVHVVQGLTEMRFGLTDILKKLKEGYDVEVQCYGFDRKKEGVIKLSFEKCEKDE